LQAQFLHQAHILAPAVIVVAGDVTGVAVDDVIGRVTKAIPDALTFAVRLPGAFDLIG